MKIYVAAAFERKPEVQALYAKLQSMGHTITADWTTHKNVKPYQDNRGIAGEYAAQDLFGALEADVFILLTSDRASTGVATEHGAAMAQYLATGKPKIYVVGAPTPSLFYFHSSNQLRDSVDEVLQEIS